MAKMNIMEIARELEIDSWVLVGILRYIGYEVEGYAMTLAEDEAQRLMEAVRALRELDAGREQGAPVAGEGAEQGQAVSFCLRCGKRFGTHRKRQPCVVCGAVCCGECSREVPGEVRDVCVVPAFGYPAGASICVSCHQDVVVRAEERLREARMNAARIETWPASLSDPPPVDKGQPVVSLVTGRFPRKREALNSLQVTALYLGCNFLFSVEYEQNETGWLASGTAGQKLHKE
jgi:hypothetical protein